MSMYGLLDLSIDCIKEIFGYYTNVKNICKLLIVNKKVHNIIKETEFCLNFGNIPSPIDLIL